MNRSNLLLLAARLGAGIPLLGIGLQHATGAAPMEPILTGAGFPLPEVGAVVAPLVEIVAGLALLVGAFPRAGALLAIGSMLGALVAHARFDWADEPPLVLPLVVLALSGIVLRRGAGTLALRRRASGDACPAPDGAPG